MRPVRLAVVLVALVLPAPAAQSAPARITAVQAEANLLLSPRKLNAVDRRLVNQRTNLVRNNTRAHCRGAGARGRLHARYVCIVSRGAIQARILYTAEGRRAFKVRILSRRTAERLVR